MQLIISRFYDPQAILHIEGFEIVGENGSLKTLNIKWNWIVNHQEEREIRDNVWWEANEITDICVDVCTLLLIQFFCLAIYQYFRYKSICYMFLINNEQRWLKVPML